MVVPIGVVRSFEHSTYQLGEKWRGRVFTALWYFRISPKSCFDHHQIHIYIPDFLGIAHHKKLYYLLGIPATADKTKLPSIKEDQRQIVENGRYKSKMK